jgi:hypothetical protein
VIDLALILAAVRAIDLALILAVVRAIDLALILAAVREIGRALVFAVVWAIDLALPVDHSDFFLDSRSIHLQDLWGVYAMHSDLAPNWIDRDLSRLAVVRPIDLAFVVDFARKEWKDRAESCCRRIETVTIESAGR